MTYPEWNELMKEAGNPPSLIIPDHGAMQTWYSRKQHDSKANPLTVTAEQAEDYWRAGTVPTPF